MGKEKKSQSVCFNTPRLDNDEILAIKECYEGTATPGHQRLALHAIVNKMARAHDNLFIPGAPDETAFLSGRAFVGAQLLKVIKLPVGRLADYEDPSENG